METNNPHRNARNAGRKPKPIDQKMIKHGGGMLTNQSTLKAV